MSELDADPTPTGDADEVRRAFVSAVSHDLRGRIGTILGFAELLSDQNADLSEEARREFAGEIVSSARRTLRLLSNLHDLDRVSRGEVRLHRETTDVGALATRVATEVGAIFHRDVEVDAAAVAADVDHVLVERILENLVTNAMKFTRAGTRVQVRAAANGDGVLLVVEDEGAGVPAEEREAVFERFRRGSQTSTTAPGSGIGLYLVRCFAELHGGRAWVEGRPEGGACFRVSLPAALALPVDRPREGDRRP
ncbi:MAG: sensor histidine kinase [Nitriliruptorales bacterium]